VDVNNVFDWLVYLLSKNRYRQLVQPVSDKDAWVKCNEQVLRVSFEKFKQIYTVPNSAIVDEICVGSESEDADYDMTKEAAKYQFRSAKGSTLIFPIENLLHEEKTLVLAPAEGSIPTWHNKEMHLREDCFPNIYLWVKKFHSLLLLFRSVEL
jgi:hypothetical protein